MGGTEYFYSLPRSQLLHLTAEQLQSVLDPVGKAVSEGWAHGVDVTGSIRESASEKSDASVYRDRLKQVLDFAGQKRASVRIHMYEGSSEGPFYNAFWDVLQGLADQSGSTLPPVSMIPPKIRIGHIAHLTESEIARLAKIQADFAQRSHIIIEANVESNLRIQGQSLQSLTQTIDRLIANGLPVVLGSDGFGILRDQSSFANTINRLLDHGLSDRAALLLIEDSSQRPAVGNLGNNPRFQNVESMLESYVLRPWESQLGGSSLSLIKNRILPRYPQILLKEREAEKARLLAFVGSLEQFTSYMTGQRLLMERIGTAKRSGGSVKLRTAGLFSTLKDTSLAKIGERELRRRFQQFFEEVLRNNISLELELPDQLRARKIRSIALEALISAIRESDSLSAIALVNSLPFSTKEGLLAKELVRAIDGRARVRYFGRVRPTPGESRCLEAVYSIFARGIQ